MDDTPCEITRQIQKDLAARSRLGLTKYGVTLDRDDLSAIDWLRHAYEETLDKAGYLLCAIKKLESQK